MKSSLLFALVDIVIGNGCGQHTFIANRPYPLKSLQADARLTAAQIRRYFREPYPAKNAK
ncbi:hypothetical protein P7_164 [Pectobacterium phage vB_PcaM_P7_Pc]|nr:hypothetical protein P7_164 [Pectobacterium phage vB_PcaM_P7_Pc]